MFSRIDIKVILVFFWSSVFTSFGQQNPSINITTADGLPSNTIETIFKDSEGTIWVGTSNGLTEMKNGEIYSYFTSDGLSNNHIMDIVEDKQQNLWLGTFGGGVVKKTKNGFIPVKGNNEFSGAKVRKLFIHDHYLLIGTERGLYVLDFNDESILAIETNHERFQIMDFISHQGIVYAGVYHRGIYRLDLNSSSLLKIRDIDLVNDGGLFSLYKDNDTLYYGVNGSNIVRTGGPIRKFTINEFIEGKEPVSVFGKSLVWNYAKDNNGNLYGAAWGVNNDDGGLYKINSNSFELLNERLGIKSTSIRSVMFDKEFNRLYVGSWDQGLFIVDLNDYLTLFSLKGEKVFDIASIDNGPVVLHDSGVSIYNQELSLEQTIPKEKMFNVFKEYLSTNNLINAFGWDDGKSIDDILFRNLKSWKNSLWISTDRGAFLLNPKKQHLKYFPINAYDFALTSEGDFINVSPYTYVSVFKDVFNKKVYYPKAKTTNSVIHYNIDGDDITKPWGVINMDEFNGVYFMTTKNNGLYKFYQGSFKSYLLSGEFSVKELDKIVTNQAKSLLAVADVSNNVYIANVENDFKLVDTIKQEEVIGNNISILKYVDDILVVGTERGINLYKGKRHWLINEENGLTNLNFTSSNFIGQHLYIGTFDGFIKLNIEAFINRKNTEIIPEIESLFVNHELKNINSFNSRMLEYSYDKNIIKLTLGVRNHPYPKQLLYSYQLNGLDSNWSAFSKDRNIELTYLPSGTFNLNLKVKDLSSGTTSTSKLCTIKITPPFWLTWWFWFLLVTFIGMAIFTAYNTRKKVIITKERQKAEIAKRLSETKLEALNSQMNPHFTFNALNSIQHYILASDTDNAMLYLNEFSRLVRATLEHSSKTYISLYEELEYLKTYCILENMRFENRVEVNFIHSGIDLKDIQIPPMLIQPFIENSFNHAFNKTIERPEINITFSLRNELLICVVKDNGIGIDKELPYHSKGMKLVKERIHLLGKGNTVQVDSSKGKGTIVTIQITPEH